MPSHLEKFVILQINSLQIMGTENKTLPWTDKFPNCYLKFLAFSSRMCSGNSHC